MPDRLSQRWGPSPSQTSSAGEMWHWGKTSLKQRNFFLVRVKAIVQHWRKYENEYENEAGLWLKGRRLDSRLKANQLDYFGCSLRARAPLFPRKFPGECQVLLVFILCKFLKAKIIHDLESLPSAPDSDMQPMKGCTVLLKKEHGHPVHIHGNISSVPPSHSPQLQPSFAI